MILGENGTGKSTLLRSLALVLAGSDALAEVLGDPSIWVVRHGAELAVIRAKVETQNAKERVLELSISRSDSVPAEIQDLHLQLIKSRAMPDSPYAGMIRYFEAQRGMV